MQPNTISYSYDHDNDGGTTAALSVVLQRHAEELHKTTYITGSHSEASADTLVLSRTLPKRAGQFLGVQRVSVKRTRTRTVKSADGLDISAPQIDELQFNIPLGVSNTAKLAALMEWIGFLSSSEGKAAMTALLNVSSI